MSWDNDGQDQEAETSCNVVSHGDVLWFDEGTGQVLNSEGCCYCFRDYPDDPQVFKDRAEAEAYLKSCHGQGQFELFTCNTMFEED